MQSKQIKEPKLWKSYDEQLEILRSRGLQIDDEKKALGYLRTIGYYRLSGYFTLSDNLLLKILRAGWMSLLQILVLMMSKAFICSIRNCGNWH